MLSDKNIGELLEENHAYASILHWHGIDAFDYLPYTLGEVCRIKNIDTGSIAHEMRKQGDHAGKTFEQLKKMSPVTLCNYLVQKHHHYAQRMLPVIEHHIKQTGITHHGQYPQLLLLANIFDTFKSDFLRHINYENTKVFPYVKKLERYTVAFENMVLLEMKDFTMEEFILKHHHDDDEMHNIRLLLKGYRYEPNDALAYKVLMNELKTFEADLQEHSRIEEDILQPVAERMEKKLKEKVNELTRLN